MKKMGGNERRAGFTIVELLIVIVVIGILAAIVVVAYNGVQNKARDTKIQSDLSQLEKAIMAARVNEQKSLWNITMNGWTADECASSANGTDLTGITACWTDYNNFLAAVSTASGINVRHLKDPWGRPYYIDENENQDSSGQCNKDTIAAYTYPHTTNGFMQMRLIANSLSGC